jgi:hypothetical protein
MVIRKPQEIRGSVTKPGNWVVVHPQLRHDGFPMDSALLSSVSHNPSGILWIEEVV